nr:hypothetical protein [Tanacetum cinerariifolium]
MNRNQATLKTIILIHMIHRVFHNKSFVVKIAGLLMKLTNQEEKQIEEDQAANAQYWKIPACCDDDDDYNSAITPNEPVDSLSMGDEHLNTIPATESDEFIKSCVENLVPNPSESEGENGCDMPACFTTFSNVLFDVDYDFYSVDNQSLSDEDFLEKIFFNPLFEEEIIPIKIDQHHHDVESDLIESMLNRDSSIISSSSKIDSLLDEFAEFVSKNCNAETESFSPSPIPIEDSDSLMEEIDLSYTPDDPMPSGIEEDEDDSKRDILIHEELLDNYSFSLPLLHLAGSQPMLKSLYKAEDGVIISIPPLVGGVTDVVVEIKDTGWSISITFRFSVGLQIPDDLSRSRLGFIDKMGVKIKQEKDKIGTKPDENGKRGRAQQCQSPVTVEKAEKKRNTNSRDHYWQILKDVFIQDKNKG